MDFEQIKKNLAEQRQQLMLGMEAEAQHQERADALKIDVEVWRLRVQQQLSEDEFMIATSLGLLLSSSKLF